MSSAPISDLLASAPFLLSRRYEVRRDFTFLLTMSTTISMEKKSSYFDVYDILTRHFTNTFASRIPLLYLEFVLWAD
jgi:hypothetical protein